MRILAIETSCDETAAAVVTGGRAVESNVVSSQIDVHRATNGVVPEVAARLQLETIVPVIEQALATTGTDWDSIDAIAVTYGPGLIGSLMVGVETAKALALAKRKPLIPVNHLAGHLYACLREENPFRFPYLGLVVSGGHTEFVRMPDHHTFEIIGSTRDDAAGEAFDKVATLLGLPYPGGPSISAAAETGDPKAIDFPRAMLDQDNLDVSFSGLKTAVRLESERGTLTKRRVADIAASFQAAVVETLVRKSRSALRRYPAAAFLLGGGVAANGALRTSMQDMLAEEGVELLVSPPELSTDNAAMIGLAAFWQKDSAVTPDHALSATPDPQAGLSR